MRWCADLTDEQLNARPAGIAPVAFHLRHIARSMDRLLTYAEGKQLSGEQMAALNTELDAGATASELFSEFTLALNDGATRIRALDPAGLDKPRKVGKTGIAYNGRRPARSRGRPHATPRGPGDDDGENRSSAEKLAAGLT